MTRRTAIYILGFILLAGCDTAPQTPTLAFDGGPPTSTLDVGVDGASGPEVGPDTDPEVGPDTQVVEPDTDPEVGPDTQVVGPDTQVEVGPDTQAEVEPDTQVVEPDTQVVEPDTQADAEVGEPDIQAEPDVVAPEDVECYHYLECPNWRGLHDVCDQYVCLQPNDCAGPEECPEGMCKDGRCFPHECESNDDCGASYPRCHTITNSTEPDLGVWRICQPCKFLPGDDILDDGCSEETPFCMSRSDGSSFCGECHHPGHCSAEAPHCMKGTCVECATDFQCFPAAPNCVENICVP